MKKIYDVEILQNLSIAKDTYQMDLEAKNIPLEEFKPGRFIHIKIGAGEKHMLRRPISIFSVDQEKKTISIIFKDLGEGTHILSKVKSGEYLNFLGPLGNGFPLKEHGKTVALVGGGVGVPPLYELGKILHKEGVKIITILGFKDIESVFAIDEFRTLGPVYIATEDGTMGMKGFVTKVLDEKEMEFDTLYACGPKVMLKALDLKYKDSKMGYFSFEERMACGTGACYGCMVETYNGLKRVCKDGPVFRMGEIIYE